jgi:ABC-2 type transport system ATP-binding protein
MNAITIENMTFGYEQAKLFEQFSLQLERGKVTSILGANGAGKTTLIQLILNQLKPISGTVKLFGASSLTSEIKQRIGALQQNATAPDKVKVGELIRLFSSYYKQPLSYDYLISRLGMTAIENKLFSDLSGGQKQVTLLALAVCGNPDLLFLDEPSVGMDIEARRNIWQFVTDLKQQGKTIILTTHYLEEAEKLSDHIVVLNKGNILVQGSPNDIKSHTNLKRIQCQSAMALEEVKSLPAVKRVIQTNRSFEVFSECAEETLKYWLNQDHQLKDLSIEASSLETAFIQLVQDNSLDSSANNQGA